MKLDNNPYFVTCSISSKKFLRDNQTRKLTPTNHTLKSSNSMLSFRQRSSSNNISSQSTSQLNQSDFFYINNQMQKQNMNDIIKENTKLRGKLAYQQKQLQQYEQQLVQNQILSPNEVMYPFVEKRVLNQANSQHLILKEEVKHLIQKMEILDKQEKNVLNANDLEIFESQMYNELKEYAGQLNQKKKKSVMFLEFKLKQLRQNVVLLQQQNLADQIAIQVQQNLLTRIEAKQIKSNKMLNQMKELINQKKFIYNELAFTEKSSEEKFKQLFERTDDRRSNKIISTTSLPNIIENYNNKIQDQKKQISKLEFILQTQKLSLLREQQNIIKLKKNYLIESKLLDEEIKLIQQKIFVGEKARRNQIDTEMEVGINDSSTISSF